MYYYFQGVPSNKKTTYVLRTPSPQHSTFHWSRASPLVQDLVCWTSIHFHHLSLFFSNGSWIFGVNVAVKVRRSWSHHHQIFLCITLVPCSSSAGIAASNCCVVDEVSTSNTEVYLVSVLRFPIVSYSAHMPPAAVRFGMAAVRKAGSTLVTQQRWPSNHLITQWDMIWYHFFHISFLSIFLWVPEVFAWKNAWKLSQPCFFVASPKIILPSRNNFMPHFTNTQLGTYEKNLPYSRHCFFPRFCLQIGMAYHVLPTKALHSFANKQKNT